MWCAHRWVVMMCDWTRSYTTTDVLERCRKCGARRVMSLNGRWEYKDLEGGYVIEDRT